MSIAFVLAIAVPAFASEAAAHSDPVASVVLSLVVILIAAKLGGEVATSLGQPSVLGELVCGLVLGNMTLLGFSGFDHIKSDPFAAAVAMVIVTTMITPPALKWTLARWSRTLG